MHRRSTTRSRLVGLLAAVAANVVPLAATPAAADTAPELSVETSFVRGNPPVRTLADVQAEWKRGRLSSPSVRDARSEAALETVGPAASWAPKVSTPAVAPKPVQPRRAGLAAGVSYPEPERSVTLQECRSNMGPKDVIYIKSRFAVCTSLQADQTWYQNGRPVGFSTMTLFFRGSVPKESDRTVRFDYDVTNFFKQGKTGTAGLLYKIEPKFPKMWPASAQVQNSGALPVTLSFDELSTRRPTAHFEHSARVAPGQGNGSVDLVNGAYEPVITSQVPPGWQGKGSSGSPFFMAVRWDAADYLRNSTGAGKPENRGSATFSYAATLNYSTAPNAPERGVAEHIKKAFTDPNHTIPPSLESKKFPGQDPKEPLNRLYSDSTRRERNNTIAVQNCKRYFSDGYSEGNTKDCDEFPFASTYQGAAYPEYDAHAQKNNFSVQPVVKEQNRDAGILLYRFYTSNRIIDGMDDGFLVNIVGDSVERGGVWKNVNSGKCLEVDGSSTENGARAQQWECLGQSGAEWLTKPSDDARYVYLVNGNSGKCLEVADSRKDNGAPVQQWDCAGLDTQKWELQSPPGARFIKNVNSGKVLEIDGSSMDNGARAQQWDNVGQPSSKWSEG